MKEAPEGLTAMAGDPARRDEVLDLVYADLQRIARNELNRHRRGHTLDTGALVHEAYLKLFASTPRTFENRRHFFATAARAMRQVVIDYARARLAERRGSGAEHLPIDLLDGAAGPRAPLEVDSQAEELIDLDRALAQLGERDERLAQVVEMRFFAGLEVKDIAELLGVSEPTIKRDTRAAKAFLHKEMTRRPTAPNA